jgi:hypothetical protein
MGLGARYPTQQQRLFVKLSQAANDRKARIFSHLDDKVELSLQVL